LQALRQSRGCEGEGVSVSAQDNDCHWYVVPLANCAEWEAWLEIPEDDERAWDVPTFAKPVGGSPILVTFTDPQF
jgi:hypothetical protein